MKKYLLSGGHVRSKYDGDKHYIAAVDLVHLYNLPKHECVLIDHRTNHEVSIGESLLLGLDLANLIPLSPRVDGDYLPHLQKMTENHERFTQNIKPVTPNNK